MFGSFISALIAIYLYRLFGRKKYTFKDKKIVITGGSQGLGAALADILSTQAKSITLWARNEVKLKECAGKLAGKKAVIEYRSVDVTKDLGGVEEGEVPDVVFCCAGASQPGWFLQQPVEVFKEGMELNYFGALRTARYFAQKMLDAKKPGRIVFISSTVGLMGMVGFSQYSPTKYALRGLAECLNQEFLVHGIQVHVYFVASIDTPGFEKEQMGKPEVTKILEGGDVSGDQSPKARAALLLRGLERKELFISSDFFTKMLMVSSSGLHTSVFDLPMLALSILVLPVVRAYFDYTIRRSPNQLH